MFKLLTEEGRQKVRHEYVMRRTAVMLIATIFVLIVIIIGLLPSYLLSNVRHNETLEWVSIINRLESLQENEGELKAWLSETNRRLKVLSPKLDVDRPSIFIEHILEQRVNSVSIENFSWVKVGDKATFLITGVASSRQSLVTFEEGLSSSGHFSEVVLPISDLAKDRDVDFQIKFSII